MEKIIVKSKADYQNFVKMLYENAKNESVEDYERHKAILNSPREVICLSMSFVRQVAKQILAGEPLEFLKFASGETYEEVLICGLVIAGLKDLEKQIELFDKWKEKIGNWSLCDSVCSSMKPLKKCKDKEKYFDYFYEMCFDKREYVARFGIITIMANFLEEKFIDQILQMAKTVSNDAYYVQMGIAWLLSMTFVYFRKQTLELIESKTLSKFVQNKTISKCHDSFRVSDEDKQMLKEFRIK